MTVTLPIEVGSDLVLIARTPDIAVPYHDLVLANRARLAQWEPWAERGMTLSQVRRWLSEGLAGLADGTQVPCVMVVAGHPGAPGLLVGSIGLAVDRTQGSAVAGYWVDAGHEGRGLITRSMVALLEVAFEQLRLRRVTLHISPDNVRSQAVAGRLGFAREGVLRDAMVFRDRRADLDVHAMTRERYTEVQASAGAVRQGA